MSDASREAAAAILGDVADEETEQPQDTAAEEVQHEADEQELPEDIRELIDQPDFEDEDDEPEPPDPEDSSDEEYLEPDAAAQLRKRALAAEKKAAYLEQLRVKTESKRWRSEAEKYFPFADAASIEATSRRGFLKKAAAEHERIKPLVEKAIQAQRAAIKEQTEAERQEQRAATADAWGKPIQTHGQTPEHVEATQKRENALRSGRFNEAVRARLSDPDDPVFKALS